MSDKISEMNEELSNHVIISEEFDKDGNEMEESYEVTFHGEAADALSLDTEYATSPEEAHEIAMDAVHATNAKIIWKCIKPSWA